MSSEQLNEPIPSNKTLALPSSASPMNGTNLPQLAEKEVTSNRTADILELKAKLEQENKEAIQLIFERLKEFYQQELDDFREEESQKLNPTKQENLDKYLQEYRIIFNKYAKISPRLSEHKGNLLRLIKSPSRSLRMRLKLKSQL